MIAEVTIYRNDGQIMVHHFSELRHPLQWSTPAGIVLEEHGVHLSGFRLSVWTRPPKPTETQP